MIECLGKLIRFVPLPNNFVNGQVVLGASFERCEPSEPSTLRGQIGNAAVQITISGRLSLAPFAGSDNSIFLLRSVREQFVQTS
jgi:hypothetical protein